MDDTFGPIRMHVHTASAQGEPKPKTVGLLSTLLRFSSALLYGRLSGNFKKTPLFDPTTGMPVVKPRVLNDIERSELMNKIHGKGK